MNLGLVIILVVIFGYISNWINWRYLNFKITQYLYYIGAFVHESSHAILCLLTGAKISEFQVFSSQPHVTHTKSKIPFVGGFLISSAPIFGGLFFLYIINHFALNDRFSMNYFYNDWLSTLLQPIKLIAQMKFEWQSLIMILLLLNVGAMLGPSIQDIKNIWPMIILSFFVPSSFLINFCLIALSLILLNILIQICLILILNIFRVKES
ncbi:MAG: M50 family metallopeptidase [bacterium]